MISDSETVVFLAIVGSLILGVMLEGANAWTIVPDMITMALVVYLTLNSGREKK